MAKYLFKKIFALILFGLALFLIPIAIPFVILIMIIIYACKMISHSGDYGVSSKEAVFLFFGGLVAFFGAFSVIDEINEYLFNSGFGLPAVFCAITIYAGVNFKSYSRQEEQYFYMDERVNKLTKYNSQLIVVAGIIRLIIEIIEQFFIEYIQSFSQYLGIGVTLGNIIFIIAIVMYIVRTIHVYIQNR